MIKLTIKILLFAPTANPLRKKQNKSTQARTGHGSSGCLRGLVLRCFFIGVEAAAGAVLPPLRRNRLKNIRDAIASFAGVAYECNRYADALA